MSSILDNIQFFGDVDRQGKKDGEAITSEYPAFYFPIQLDELRETVEKTERNLKLGLVPASEREYAEADLRRSKERLKKIQNSMPKFNAKEKDALAKVRSDLGDQIGDSMFTRTEMRKGLANAHEEARRMSEPIIKVGGAGKLFENMGIKPVRGKVSRNQASKMWKVIGKILEEPTNTEYLRKDSKHGTYHSDVPIEQMI